jgi:Na+-translocating ferredoxin:NAD+ oxidoreductase RnfD subunit
MKRLLKSLLCEDKLKHIVVSAIIAVALNLFLPWLAAAGIAFAIGVGKEVYDMVSGKGCSEWGDLLADVVGIIIGIL